MRLQKVQFKYDLHKYCFTNRVVNTWNSLPHWVVTAESTNIFKTRLDTFWHNKHIMYDNVHNLRELEVEVKFRIKKYI